MIGEPVVVTPPRKKESIAVDLVAVKKAVDASSTVQEARRIAREAKEQASRASVTAEAIIKEATQRSTKKLTQKTTTSITKKLAPKTLPTAGKVVRNITKKSAPQVINKTLQNSEGVFLRALKNPAVVDAIVKKIGKEGAD